MVEFKWIRKIRWMEIVHFLVHDVKSWTFQWKLPLQSIFLFSFFFATFDLCKQSADSQGHACLSISSIPSYIAASFPSFFSNPKHCNRIKWNIKSVRFDVYQRTAHIHIQSTLWRSFVCISLYKTAQYILRFFFDNFFPILFLFGFVLFSSSHRKNVERRCVCIEVKRM